jgi:hypothetical protein
VECAGQPTTTAHPPPLRGERRLLPEPRDAGTRGDKAEWKQTGRAYVGGDAAPLRSSNTATDSSTTVGLPSNRHTMGAFLPTATHPEVTTSRLTEQEDDRFRRSCCAAAAADGLASQHLGAVPARLPHDLYKYIPAGERRCTPIGHRTRSTQSKRLTLRRRPRPLRRSC